MHVSKKMFDTMLSEAEDVELSVMDFPKGKGGRSVLFTRKI